MSHDPRLGVKIGQTRVYREEPLTLCRVVAVWEEYVWDPKAQRDRYLSRARLKIDRPPPNEVIRACSTVAKYRKVTT